MCIFFFLSGVHIHLVTRCIGRRQLSGDNPWAQRAASTSSTETLVVERLSLLSAHGVYHIMVVRACGCPHENVQKTWCRAGRSGTDMSDANGCVMLLQPCMPSGKINRLACPNQLQQASALEGTTRSQKRCGDMVTVLQKKRAITEVSSASLIDWSPLRLATRASF